MHAFIKFSSLSIEVKLKVSPRGFGAYRSSESWHGHWAGVGAVRWCLVPIAWQNEPRPQTLSRVFSVRGLWSSGQARISWRRFYQYDNISVSLSTNRCFVTARLSQILPHLSVRSISNIMLKSNSSKEPMAATFITELKRLNTGSK